MLAEKRVEPERPPCVALHGSGASVTARGFNVFLLGSVGRDRELKPQDFFDYQILRKEKGIF